MPMGTVKFWLRDKGLGFIVPDGGGEDIYIDKSAVGDECLKAGQKISYSLEWDYKHWNWKIGQCEFPRFQQQTDVDKDYFVNGRRLKPPEKLGLNQGPYAKNASSSPGSRAKRFAKRHQCYIDPNDL